MEAIEDDTFEYRLDDAAHYKDLIYMHLSTNHAVLTQDNSVRIYSDGAEKFKALLKDIETAKDHIHIQYYIFKMDNLGRHIYNELIKKQSKGYK